MIELGKKIIGWGAKIGILAAILFGAFFFVYGNVDIPEGRPVAQFRGVIEPSLQHALMMPVRGDLDRIKATGFTTVSIHPLHPVMFGKVRTIPFQRTLIAFFVKRAHIEGLSVFLSPMVGSPLKRPIDEEMAVDPVFQDDVADIALNWAEFAKRYDIELYAPLYNAETVLGRDGATHWAEEIVSDIRERFDGRIAFKQGNCVVPAEDPAALRVVSQALSAGESSQDIGLYFSDCRGFDYLMFDFFAPTEVRNIDGITADLGVALRAANAHAARSGSKGVIACGLTVPLGRVASAALIPGPVLTADEQASVALQTMKTAMDAVDGAFYFGWRFTGYGLAGTPAEEAVRSLLTDAPAR